MADIRNVTPDFSVAPQLTPEDMAEAAASGFVLVINNRPDNEAPGQPESATMQSAAQAAGMDYIAIPVRGGPTAEQGRAVKKAVDSAGGPVLAFCRSGTRSVTAWSLGRLQAGDDRSEILRVTRAAGYDLDGAI